MPDITGFFTATMEESEGVRIALDAWAWDRRDGVFEHWSAPPGSGREVVLVETGMGAADGRGGSVGNSSVARAQRDSRRHCGQSHGHARRRRTSVRARRVRRGCGRGTVFWSGPYLEPEGTFHCPAA